MSSALLRGQVSHYLQRKDLSVWCELRVEDLFVDVLVEIADEKLAVFWAKHFLGETKYD